MSNPAPAVPSRIEIPQFPAGKRIAVTTSWDDGAVEVPGGKTTAL